MSFIRWKITIEYHGAGFHGWQRQNDTVTVQGILEDAAIELTGQPIEIHGAGRTDAGVHALAQVAHVDLPDTLNAKAVRDGLTYYAQIKGHPVSVIKAEAVPPDFHARFHAIMRHYRYVIRNRISVPVIGADLVWHVRKPLNEKLMQEAARHLIGEHDFTSFRTVDCQAHSPVRTLSRFDISRQGDDIIAEISAPSFLHHQVRNFMGTMRKVGLGEWSPAYVKEILEARDRREAGMNAPPEGLFLTRVDYPEAGS